MPYRGNNSKMDQESKSQSLITNYNNINSSPLLQRCMAVCMEVRESSRWPAIVSIELEITMTTPR